MHEIVSLELVITNMSRLIDHSSRVELPALCAGLATDSSPASSRACLHNEQNRIKLFQL